MSKTIAIDLDGVIFDTERYFRVASEIEVTPAVVVRRVLPC